MEVEQIPDAQSLEVIPESKPAKVPTAKTIANIAVAVEARIGGETWETVAPLIGRKHAASARELPQEYPALWREAWDIAYADKADVLEGKTTTRLFDLEDHEEGKVAVQACNAMLRHLDRIRPMIITTRQATASASTTGAHVDKTKMTSADLIKLGLKTIEKETVSVTTKRRR